MDEAGGECRTAEAERSRHAEEENHVGCPVKKRDGQRVKAVPKKSA